MSTPADQAAPPQSIEDRLYAQFDAVDDPPLTMAPPDEAGLQDAQDDEPDADTPPAEEAVEIEFEGRKVSIPKFLEPAILKNADYTQKTQELAEQRRIVEHQQQVLKAASLDGEFQQATAEERKHLQAVESFLDQARGIDWNNLAVDEAFPKWAQINQAKELKASIESAIEAKRAEFRRKQDETVAEIRRNAREVLNKQIRGITDEAIADLTRYAQSFGYTAQDAEMMTLDPRALALAYKAKAYDDLKAKADAGLVKTTTPAVKPGATNPMPQQVRDKLNYRKAIAKATNSKQREAVIARRLGDMF